jgi:hypothetical protein
VAEQGLRAVSTVGAISSRTDEEIGFLTEEILEIYPAPADMAIDFGSGWGRLLPVLAETSRNQILVDFIERNRTLCEQFYPHDLNYEFVVSTIKDFCAPILADFVLESFSLLHIVDEQEYKDSVRNIIDSVKPGGHLFIYESYNESGRVAPHCSSRNREQFLEPFSDCELIKEVDWQSEYQPYETVCHQPIKLFIFRR